MKTESSKTGAYHDGNYSKKHLGEDTRRVAAMGLRSDDITHEFVDFYRTLAEAAQEMIYIISREGKVLYINSSAANALGMPASDIIGKMREDLFSRSINNRQEKDIKRVFKTETSLYGEDLEIFNEKEVWLGTQLVPLKDKNGTVYAVLGISRDITEHKRDEESLRESEDRFRAIFEQVAVGIAQVDFNGRFIRVNQKFCDITGYSHNELIKLDFWDITYPPDIPEEKERLSNLLSGEASTYSREKRYVRKDGSLIWVNLTAAIIRHNGKPVNMIGVTQDISKRKQAEEALWESEERFCQMAESIKEIFFMVSRDWEHVVYISPAYENIFGRSLESIYADSKSWLEAIHPEDRECVIEVLKKEISGIFSDRGTEFRIIRPDGRLRWVYTRTYPVLNEHGEVCQITGIVEDITEKKLSEVSMRMALFSIERAADIVMWVDRDGCIIYVNEAACKAYGYSRDEMLAKRTLDINLLFNKNNWDEHWKEVKDRGSITFEAMQRRKDGSFFPAEVSVNYMLYEGKEHHSAYIRDITERKRAESELVRVNRALQAISKCNEAMIHAKEEYSLLEDICKIIVEVGGYRMAWIGYAEKNAQKTVRKMAKTGYDVGYVDNARIAWSDTKYGRGPTGTAIRTKKPYVARSILTDPHFLPWRAEALKRGYASTLGLPLIADDQAFGALTIYSEKPNAFDTDEIVLLQELADNLAYGITSLRSQAKREKAERELKEAKAQSEMYLDLMGHDINNMNQIALGFLELAIDTLPLDDQARELIIRPREALESSTNLINNVRRLQLAKNGVLQFHDIEVGRILDEVIPRFQNIVGREIMIRNMYECECRVMANGLLDDVFSNIIGNAIKHSKGALTISVKVTSTFINNKKFCRVDIEDNGPGIPDELKNTLFNRFRSETRRASGKGLGLYLISTLVEDFHGRTWIENRVPGDHTKGSRFVVLLPSVDQR